MHTTGTRSLILALLLLPLGQPAMAQEEATTTSFTSDDGLVTLLVPDGAVPDDTDVTIRYRPSEDAPEELIDLAGAGAPSHYLVEPTELVFGPPARFVRQVPLGPLGQSAAGPQVLGMLAVRGDDETWSWLSDLGFQVDSDTDSLVLSGDLPGGGQVFAFGTGVIWADLSELWGYAAEDPIVATADLSMQSFLGLAPTDNGYGVSMNGVSGTTGDETIAVAGEPVLDEVDRLPVATLPFRCVSPGTTDTGLRFTLDGVGDDVNVTQWLELPASRVDVETTGAIECLEW